ncbi:MAG: hemin uptake protein HemP [Planctomycetota bacterium]
MPDENQEKANPEPQPTAQAVRVVESADLLAGGKAVVIHHDSEYYRLIVTRNGKLLLQK